MSLKTYTVSGMGEFPHDMMRYDRCEFASPEDRERAGKGYVHGPRRSIQVTTEGNRLTHGRWESFNWRVSDGSETTLTDAVIARMESRFQDPLGLYSTATTAAVPVKSAEEILKDLQGVINGMPKPKWALFCPDGTLVSSENPRDILLHMYRTVSIDTLMGGV